jgi:hypothetical protein
MHMTRPPFYEWREGRRGEGEGEGEGEVEVEVEGEGDLEGEGEVEVEGEGEEEGERQSEQTRVSLSRALAAVPALGPRTRVPSTSSAVPVPWEENKKCANVGARTLPRCSRGLEGGRG